MLSSLGCRLISVTSPVQTLVRACIWDPKKPKNIYPHPPANSLTKKHRMKSLTEWYNAFITFGVTDNSTCTGLGDYVICVEISDEVTKTTSIQNQFSERRRFNNAPSCRYTRPILENRSRIANFHTGAVAGQRWNARGCAQERLVFRCLHTKTLEKKTFTIKENSHPRSYNSIDLKYVCLVFAHNTNQS